MSGPIELDVLVVGAGFAGMYQLHAARQLGLSVRAVETGDGVGGTWYWNCYPGARVDSPSLNYSMSFSPELEQEWSWSEMYAQQGELLRYANHIADRFDLRRDIQFETTVIAAAYDADTNRWRVDTDRGDRFVVRYLITAIGCLSASNIPDLKGLESFEGQWYHTSRWPKQSPNLDGLRIGVIGTGSTGVQAVTAMAKVASQLYVFQRTPNFSLPSTPTTMDPDYVTEYKAHYRDHRERARWSATGSASNVPVGARSALDVDAVERQAMFEAAWAQVGIDPRVVFGRMFNDLLTNLDSNATVSEFIRGKIREIVKDPDVAESLSPREYPIFTKRICVDTGYYEAFNQDNVTLVDLRKTPLEEVTATGVRTTDQDYDLDVIVFATGFDAMTGPLLRMNITGRDGQRLADAWEAGPRTYLGLMTVGFPNLFMITGPGSPSVLGNVITSIEQHVELITDTLRHLEANDIVTMEPTLAAQDGWVEHVNEAAAKTLYTHANSWYLGANIDGKPRVFMPYVAGFGTYRRECEEIVANGYEGFELVRR